MSDFGSALLVIGSESLLVERAVDDRVQKAYAERPGAELVDLGPAEVASGRFPEVVGGSLFSTSTILVIREIPELPPEQVDLLLRTASQPGEDICLTLTHPGGVKGKTLLDRLNKAKVPRVTIEKVKAWDLPQFVVAEAKRVKLGLDLSTATVLVEAVGNDLHALAGAVSQLAVDWPGQTLSYELVNRYFAGRAEVSGFAISDAIMGGHPDKALGLLRWALETGTPAVLITGALAAALRNLGKYLGLRSQRLSSADLAREVGVPSWKLKDLSGQARWWTETGVAQGITALAEADAQVKGASTDPQYALEHLLMQLDQARRQH